MANVSERINPEEVANIPTAADYNRLRVQLDNAVSFIKNHSETLGQLGAMFAAIKAGRPRFDELAGAGLYLADDMAEIAAGQAEDLEKVLAEVPEEPPHWMIDKDCECPDCLVDRRIKKSAEVRP